MLRSRVMLYDWFILFTILDWTPAKKQINSWFSFLTPDNKLKILGHLLFCSRENHICFDIVLLQWMEEWKLFIILTPLIELGELFVMLTFISFPIMFEDYVIKVIH